MSVSHERQSNELRNNGKVIFDKLKYHYFKIKYLNLIENYCDFVCSNNLLIKYIIIPNTLIHNLCHLKYSSIQF